MIHKERALIRSIIPLPGTQYKLVKEISKRLKNLISKCEHKINNAIQFLDKPRNITIDKDEVMLSFDVTVLFIG